MFTRTTTLTTVVLALSLSHAHAQHNHAAHQHEGHQGPAGAPASPAPAATQNKKPIGPHGGALHEVGALRVEPVVEASGLRLYAYNQDGQPLDLRSARGLATLQVKGAAKRYRYDLFPELRKDGAAESVAVAVDLRRIAGHPIEIKFQLVGVATADRKPAEFTVAITAPMSKEQLVAAVIAEQKVCPVSGQPLGSMGGPIPVTVGKETIYVCCKGCVAPVQAEPAKYLAMVRGSTGSVPPGSEEVRPGIYKVTAADQPFITAQKKCPVMDEPLNAMGGPYKVHAAGKAIYICCPGCAKKIIAEPAKYLQVLQAQGVTPPTLQTAAAGRIAPALGEQVRPGVFKVTAGDRPFVEAQKVCPVMDEPLDAMGGPYRVNVEGRAVYICCPGCAKKLQADPKTYLEVLAKQGVTPPTAK